MRTLVRALVIAFILALVPLAGCKNVLGPVQVNPPDQSQSLGGSEGGGQGAAPSN